MSNSSEPITPECEDERRGNRGKIFFIQQINFCLIVTESEKVMLCSSLWPGL